MVIRFFSVSYQGTVVALIVVVKVVNERNAHCV